MRSVRGEGSREQDVIVRDAALPNVMVRAPAIARARALLEFEASVGGE